MGIQNILNHFQSYKLTDQILRGIERECLRTSQDGHISQRAHFKDLGASLTHPFITTDYSEALLEFVTPVYNSPKDLLEFLENIQAYAAQKIGDEIFWNNSMPCLLKKTDQIPIADYGTSNIGKMKQVYRRGLYHRYGSAMQAISGIHFNFSLSDDFFSKLQTLAGDKISFTDFRSKTYMSCIRNINKYSWIIPYFMGSSPVICKSFLNKCSTTLPLQKVDQLGSLSFDGATSLRLSNLGYTNSAQDDICINYNSLSSYVNGLKNAISTESDKFSKIKTVNNGQFQQLNSFKLQLENEYYAEVRPKRVVNSGESPTAALSSRGIEYIELRSVDINTFSPIGINLEQVLFLDIFILFCLFEDSHFHNESEMKKFRVNQELTARHGRDHSLKLFNGKEEINGMDFVKEIFQSFFKLANQLDQENDESAYSEAISTFYNKIECPEKLYSAKLLSEMKENNQSYFENNLKRSIDFSQKLKMKKLSSDFISNQDEIVKRSFLAQAEIEINDTMDFEKFLNTYLNKYHRN